MPLMILILRKYVNYDVGNVQKLHIVEITIKLSQESSTDLLIFSITSYNMQVQFIA